MKLITPTDVFSKRTYSIVIGFFLFILLTLPTSSSTKLEEESEGLIEGKADDFLSLLLASALNKEERQVLHPVRAAVDSGQFSTTESSTPATVATSSSSSSSEDDDADADPRDANDERANGRKIIPVIDLLSPTNNEIDDKKEDNDKRSNKVDLGWEFRAINGSSTSENYRLLDDQSLGLNSLDDSSAGGNGMKREEDDFDLLGLQLDLGEEKSEERRQSGRSQAQYNPRDKTPENRQGGLKEGYLLPDFRLIEETTTLFPVRTPKTTAKTLTTTAMPPPTPPPAPPEPQMPADWRLLPKIPIKASDIFDGCGLNDTSDTPTPAHLDPVKQPKTCFLWPEDCGQTTPCRMAAAISPTAKTALKTRRKRQAETNDSNGAGEDELEALTTMTSQWIRITMEATAPEGFVAIGFSDDTWMGDDFIIWCGQGPLGHLVTIHIGVNEKDKYQNSMSHDSFHFEGKHKRVKRLRGYAQDNGVVACDFEILFPNPTNPVEGGSSKEWYVMMAFGKHSNYLDFNSVEKDYGSLLFHHMAIVSDTKISHSSLINNPQMLKRKSQALIKVHAYLSILAFALCIPLSMFFAEYGREAYSNIMFKNIPQWMFMHLVFSILGIVFMIPGMILIAVELEWKWRSVGGKAAIHSILGVCASIILLLNFIIGAVGFGVQGKHRRIKSLVESLRGNPIERQRMVAHYFRWIHWYLGQCIYFFGMVSLFFSSTVRRAEVPCAIMYVAGLQLLIHFLTHLFMALNTYQLVMEIDGKYVLRRVLPGPMLPWVECDLLSFETDKEFYALDVWDGRRIAIKFYCATTLICVITMCVFVGYFMPLVICRRHIGAGM